MAKSGRLGWIGAVALLLACGHGSSQGVPSDDAGPVLDASQTLDATLPSEDAGQDSSTKLSLPDSAPPPPNDDDAGTCAFDAASLAGHVPASHRPAGSTCPARGSSVPTSFCGEDASAVQCTTDSECTAGKTGRCLLKPAIPPPGCQPPYCSYDDCESDSDCSGVPCICRAAGTANPNVCATGSNCVIDSDCGSGGYCSPGGPPGDFCDQADTFYCHGAADTCIDDTDCCSELPVCHYDVALGHFACRSACPAPP